MYKTTRNIWRFFISDLIECLCSIYFYALSVWKIEYTNKNRIWNCKYLQVYSYTDMNWELKGNQIKAVFFLSERVFISDMDLIKRVQTRRLK